MDKQDEREIAAIERKIQLLGTVIDYLDSHYSPNMADLVRWAKEYIEDSEARTREAVQLLTKKKHPIKIN